MERSPAFPVYKEWVPCLNKQTHLVVEVSGTVWGMAGTLHNAARDAQVNLCRYVVLEARSRDKETLQKAERYLNGIDQDPMSVVKYGKGTAGQLLFATPTAALEKEVERKGGDAEVRLVSMRPGHPSASRVVAMTPIEFERLNRSKFE